MALSTESPGKATAASPSQYLTFELGDEMFAVGTLNVREIIEYGPITSVPLASPRSLAIALSASRSVASTRCA